MSDTEEPVRRVDDWPDRTAREDGPDEAGRAYLRHLSDRLLEAHDTQRTYQSASRDLVGLQVEQAPTNEETFDSKGMGKG